MNDWALHDGRGDYFIFEQIPMFHSKMWLQFQKPRRIGFYEDRPAIELTTTTKFWFFSPFLRRSPFPFFCQPNPRFEMVAREAERERERDFREILEHVHKIHYPPTKSDFNNLAPWFPFLQFRSLFNVVGFLLTATDLGFSPQITLIVLVKMQKYIRKWDGPERAYLRRQERRGERRRAEEEN